MSGCGIVVGVVDRRVVDVDGIVRTVGVVTRGIVSVVVETDKVVAGA